MTIQDVLRVKLLSSRAVLPTKGSNYAAGYDLFSSADVIIPAMGKAIVPTDISIAIPLYFVKFTDSEEPTEE
jgi:dUTP pyrophosphatase